MKDLVDVSYHLFVCAVTNVCQIGITTPIAMQYHTKHHCTVWVLGALGFSSSGSRLIGAVRLKIDQYHFQHANLGQ